jgi:hypothetical protein
VTGAYLLALGLTLVIEVPVALLVLRRRGWRAVLPAALLANLISHPLLHFALPRVLSPADRGTFLLVGELGVFVLEALVYLLVARPRPRAMAVVAAALANAASYAVGLLLAL